MTETSSSNLIKFLETQEELHRLLLSNLEYKSAEENVLAPLLGFC